jgi:hypothetical protein
MYSLDCPICKKRSDADAERCPHCGHEITEYERGQAKRMARDVKALQIREIAKATFSNSGEVLRRLPKHHESVQAHIQKKMAPIIPSPDLQASFFLPEQYQIGCKNEEKEYVQKEEDKKRQGAQWAREGRCPKCGGSSYRDNNAKIPTSYCSKCGSEMDPLPAIWKHFTGSYDPPSWNRGPQNEDIRFL